MVCVFCPSAREAEAGRSPELEASQHFIVRPCLRKKKEILEDLPCEWWDSTVWTPCISDPSMSSHFVTLGILARNIPEDAADMARLDFNLVR
jgi:hypothetical protein